MSININKIVADIRSDDVTHDTLVSAISTLVEGIERGEIECRVVQKKKPAKGCTIADDVNFESAFMTAWAMGFDTFEWRGSRYSTTRKDGSVARKTPMITRIWEHQDA